MLHRVDYVRGTKRVHCATEDVWRETMEPDEDDKGGHRAWEPTPWALAVCRYHPDVTELWLADRVPNRTTSENDGRTVYAWWREGDGPHGEQLPNPIFDALVARHTNPLVPRARITADTFPTEDAARAALANRLACWVHEFLSPNG